MIGIFLFSIILYLPSLMGGAIWDDVDLIKGKAFGGNTLVAAFTKPFLGHYFRPFTSASFVIDSSYAKETPFFYHQTNILLHAVTAVFVSCLVLAITDKKGAGILAGLFFAAQPLQVAAAGWIGGRTDVLSAFFLAAFMLCLVRYHKAATSNKVWLALATLMFLFGALAKEQALAIFPAVPLSVFAFGSRKWKDAWRLCIPFGIAVVVFIVLWIIDAPAPVGARSSIFYAVTLALRTAAFYGLALLAPNRPSLLTYTLENYRGVLWIAVGAALVAGFIFLVRYLWKNHRPWAWVAICALLVYIPVGNLPPVASFVTGPYRVAESGPAAAALLGIGCAYAFAKKWYLLAGAFLANLAVGAYVSWWGIHQWSTPLSFFEEVAKNDPHFLIGVGNYAHSLDLENRPEEELRITNRTLTWVFGTDKWEDLLANEKMSAFTPDVIERLRTNNGIPDKKALGWFISCHASGLSREDKPAEAIKVEREALMVGPKDARIHFAYGQLVIKTDRQDAIKHWEIALKLAPTYTACAGALAHERVVDGRYAEAVKLLDFALPDVGWNGSYWIDMANAKLGLHDLAGARKALFQARKALFVKKADVEACQKKIDAFAGSRAGA